MPDRKFRTREEPDEREREGRLNERVIRHVKKGRIRKNTLPSLYAAFFIRTEHLHRWLRPDASPSLLDPVLSVSSQYKSRGSALFRPLLDHFQRKSFFLDTGPRWSRQRNSFHVISTFLSVHDPLPRETSSTVSVFPSLSTSPRHRSPPFRFSNAQLTTWISSFHKYSSIFFDTIKRQRRCTIIINSTSIFSWCWIVNRLELRTI